MEAWLEEMRESSNAEYVRRLQAMDYGDYLRSGHWRQLRRDTLRSANYLCVACGDDLRLQVHHLTYERRGCEREEDLTVLCNGCHERVSPVRRSLATKLKALSEAKGVSYQAPANQGAAKAMLRDLEAMRDASEGDPRHLNFYRLAAAQQGDSWPSMPLGITLAIQAERLALLDALLASGTLGPTGITMRPWDGARLASTRPGR